MALIIDKKEITQVTANRRIISEIWHGAELIWQAIRSCFGSGMWISEKPWTYNEGWRSTKKHN